MAKIQWKDNCILAGLRQRPQISVPKQYIGALREEIKNVKEKIVSGKQSVFDNVDALVPNAGGIAECNGSPVYIVHFRKSDLLPL